MLAASLVDQMDLKGCLWVEMKVEQLVVLQDIAKVDAMVEESAFYLVVVKAVLTVELTAAVMVDWMADQWVHCLN